MILRRALRRLSSALAAPLRGVASTGGSGRPARVGGRIGIGLRIVVAVALVSVVLAGGAFAASRLSTDYGGGRASVNSLSWAARAATYSRTACTACHDAITSSLLGAAHGGVACESCHAPIAAHPGSGRGLVALPVPDSGVCVTCHRRTDGRPAAFAQVELQQHYRGADCLRCHDPHTTRAEAPPEVTHPLTNLPACTTCHAPDGLKRFPEGHTLVADDVCLACHGPRARKD